MFTGFTDKEDFTPIPGSFFRELLNEITEADELKVTLYALWRVGNMENSVHALHAGDFADLLPDPESALEKAVLRRTLIRVQNDAQVVYFLNSPRGRAAAEALSQGVRQISGTPSMPPLERPNIFKIYEENIGPLTPMIADMLRDSEKDYPEEWIVDAMGIAVKNNKRNWKYVEAILRRWKEEGHAEKQARPNSQEDRRRYSEGEFSEYLKRN